MAVPPALAVLALCAVMFGTALASNFYTEPHLYIPAQHGGRFIYQMQVRVKYEVSGDIDCFFIGKGALALTNGDFLKGMVSGSEALGAGFGSATSRTKLSIFDGATESFKEQDGYGSTPLIFLQVANAAAGTRVCFTRAAAQEPAMSDVFVVSLQLITKTQRPAGGVATGAVDLAPTLQETTGAGTDLSAAGDDLSKAWLEVKWFAQAVTAAPTGAGVTNGLNVFFQMPTTNSPYTILSVNARPTDSTDGTPRDSFSTVAQKTTKINDYLTGVGLFSGAQATEANTDPTKADMVYGWSDALELAEYSRDIEDDNNIPATHSNGEARILGFTHAAAEKCYKVTAWMLKTATGGTANLAVDIFIAGVIAPVAQDINVCHANTNFGTTCQAGDTFLPNRDVRLNRVLSLCPDTATQTPFPIGLKATAVTGIAAFTNLWSSGKLTYGTSTSPEGFDIVNPMANFDINTAAVGTAAVLKAANAITAGAAAHIPMLKSQTMSATILLDLRADGAPDPNTPIGGLKVFLRTPTTVVEATTAADTGIATFTNIPPGKNYFMDITDANYVDKAYAREHATSDFKFTHRDGNTRPIWCTAGCTITSNLDGKQAGKTGYLYRTVDVTFSNFFDDNGNGLLDAPADIENQLDGAGTTTRWSVDGAAPTTGTINFPLVAGPYVNKVFNGQLSNVAADVKWTRSPPSITTGKRNVFVETVGDVTKATFTSSSDMQSAPFTAPANGGTKYTFYGGVVKAQTVKVQLILDLNADGLKAAGDVAAIFLGDQPTATIRDKNGAPGTVPSAMTWGPGSIFQLKVNPGSYEVQITLPATHTYSPTTAQNPWTPDTTNPRVATYSITVRSTVAPATVDALVNTPAFLRIYTFLDQNANNIEDAPNDVALSSGDLNIELTTGAARTPVSPSRYRILPPTVDAGKSYIPIQIIPGTQFEYVKLSDRAGGKNLVPEAEWKKNPTTVNLAIETNQAEVGGVLADGLKTAASGTTYVMKQAAGTQFPFIEYVTVAGVVYEDMNGSGDKGSDETAPRERAADRSELRVSATSVFTGGVAPVPFPDQHPSSSYIADDGKVFFLVVKGNDKVRISVEDPRTNGYVQTGTNSKIYTTDIGTKSSSAVNFGVVGFYKLHTITLNAFEDTTRDGLREAGEAGRTGSVTITDNTGRAIAAIGGVILPATGKLTVNNVHPGFYTVVFPSDPSRVFAPLTSGGSNVDLTGKVAVTVLSGGPSNPLAAIAGYQVPGSIRDFFVWEDGNGNGIFEGSESPLSLLVTLTGPGVQRTATTDSSGKVSFVDLPIGPYTLAVTSPGSSWQFSPSGQGTNPALNSDANGSGLVSASITDSSFTVTNLAAGLFKLGSLEISVYNDLNGNARRDALEGGFSGHHVTLTRTNGELFSATSDNDGFMRFDELLPPGEYSGVAFTDPGQNIQPGGSIPPSGRFSLTVTSGLSNPTLQYGIVQAVDQVVTVWHDLNGDGLQQASEPGYGNARVTLTTPTGVVLAGTTDSTGRHTFSKLFPDPLPYTFKLEPQGQEKLTKSVEGTTMVDAKGERSVLIKSRTTPEEIKAGIFVLSGPIIVQLAGDSNGNGILDAGEVASVGVSVELSLSPVAIARRSEDGLQQQVFNLVETKETDENGRASFPNLIPGLYNLRVVFGADSQMSVPSADNEFDVDGNVEVRTPSNTGTILKRGMITSRTTLQGKVVTQFGLPVGKVTVGVWSNGTPKFILPTKEDGTYSITPFPPGSYLVVFTPPADHFVATPTDGTASVTINPGDNTVVDAILGAYPSAVVGTPDATFNDPGAVYVPVRVVGRTPGDTEALVNTGPGLVARSSRHVFGERGVGVTTGYQNDEYWSRNNYGVDNDGLVSPDIFNGAASLAPTAFALLALLPVLLLLNGGW